MVTEQFADLLAQLPAGPWAAFGDTVYAGNKPVLTARGADGPSIARAVAHLPDAVRVLIAAHPDVMAARIEELEAEVARYKRSLAQQENMVDHLEPRAYAACLTPPEGCRCTGCEYRQEWKGES